MIAYRRKLIICQNLVFGFRVTLVNPSNTIHSCMRTLNEKTVGGLFFNRDNSILPQAERMKANQS